ncbi:cytosol aminopeptidase-like [Lineus longissimus]|uniref:cytosol aminopeptidase-like n=1 Tax=Lineus longissimus TaxID=88925 RepID=UPI002B4D84F8
MATNVKMSNFRNIFRNYSINQLLRARLHTSSASKSNGIIIGIHDATEKNGQPEFTSAGQNFNNRTKGKLADLMKICGTKLKKGQSRLLYGIDDEFPSVAVVGLGKKSRGYDEQEEIFTHRDSVREAVAGGARQLRDVVGVTKIEVDPCGDAEAAGEGAHLGLFYFDQLKDKEKKKSHPDIKCRESEKSIDAQFGRGGALAEGQNFARWLMEMPANKMTPTIFAEEVFKALSHSKESKVTIRDQAWAESKQMGAFLSVSRGSEEPLKFVEIDYNGASTSETPFALVGKGVTFDTGGISIKPAANMDLMRADMGGAACVAGTFLTLSKLGVPVNVKGFIPLCENMPSGKATKPGDVVTAMNGKTIQVDNTDAEGRLILADALCYADSFKPKGIIDMATLTGAVAVALGTGASGVFTNSNSLWNKLHKAGTWTGDRLWRLPLWKHYSRQVTNSHLADLSNVGKYSRDGGSCTAAAFLKEFTTNPEWVHIDIAGVMQNTDEVPYLVKGLTGRPTRTIIEFLCNLAKEGAKDR